jgi:TonB family protein
MKQVRRWWREYNVEIIGSVILHGGLAMLLASSKGCMPEITQPKPVTKINVVSLGSIKKSKVPDRASRKERPSAPKPSTPPKSSQKVDAPKPPTPPSEQMTVPKEEPKKEPEKEKPIKEEPKKEEPKEKKEDSTTAQTREELIRKAQREQLLKSLQNAPVGPKDREATSQEGTDKTLPGLPSADPSDPILAQYISQARDKIIPNWAPLPTLVEAHPEYEVIIEVQVLADGTLRNPKVVKKSGDASFDAAAIRAIYKTVSLPPPPEKWKASAAQGILITLAAADKT